MDTSYRRERTSVTLINYHFVWIPVRRKALLVGAVGERARALIDAQVEALGCHLLALEVMPDHVHLFLNAPPNIAPDQLMYRIKGQSSRVLRQEFPHLLRLPSFWTRSYYCGTAGDVSNDTIKRYIAEQRTR